MFLNNCLIILIIFKLNLINGALLFWSTKKIEISPFQNFNNDDFTNLIENLDNPEIFIYQTRKISPILRDIFTDYNFAYHPDGLIESENATNILADSEEDLLKIKNDIENFKTDILSVMIIPNNSNNKRFKRELNDETITPSEYEETIPKGPVLYKGKSKKDDYGLLYSSRPLLLKMNSSDTYLGNTSPDMITVDTVARDSYSRLNVLIPLKDGGKITLRFLFSWLGSYWYLETIKIEFTNENLSFNLKTDLIINAPAHFSYHCSDKIIFTDNKNNIKLYLYDLQVQIDSINGRFNDAYDCVNFFTGPIWSGIFVTVLLGIGLTITLISIMDIKTMDKFDNYKTKQLVITLNE